MALPCGIPSHKLLFFHPANLRSVWLKRMAFVSARPGLPGKSWVNRSPGEDHFFTRARGGLFQGNERLPLYRGEGNENLLFHGRLFSMTSSVLALSPFHLSWS